MASANMIAKYDAGNPDALRRAVAGAQLKAFPRPVLQACREASQKVFQELGAKDPMFHDSMAAFRGQGDPLVPRRRGRFDGLMAAPGQPET